MKKFDYTELVKEISKIKIDLEGDEVATYFDGREVSRKRVSTKYEIFDFRPFVIRSIDEVRKNYEILEYNLTIVGGRQEIKLVSVPEEIEGETFQRSFYILNSSDCSRALSFSYGLKHNDFDYISKKGTIYKKHYTGITEYVEDRVDLDDSIFQEQIELFKKIIGDSIFMSNVQKIITESDVLKNSKVTLKNNFYKFCEKLSYLPELTKEQKRSLKKGFWIRESEDFIVDSDKDFMVDSFKVFKTYLKLFNTKDAGVIRRESERISKMGVSEIRNNSLDQLLMD
jgi:hypothetical protein